MERNEAPLAAFSSSLALTFAWRVATMGVTLAMINYYDVLGITQNSTTQEIKKIFPPAGQGNTPGPQAG